MVGTYYFCMTFVGTLMPELYKKQGYKPENPGRIINNVANCLVASRIRSFGLWLKAAANSTSSSTRTPLTREREKCARS